MVGKRWAIVVAIPVAVTSGYIVGRCVSQPTPYAAVYFSPGPDCEDHIITEINRAQKIDIAVYSITNRKIADAIISAHLRGAKIRIVTDRTMAKNRHALNAELLAAGIPVLTHRQYRIEHNKFAIFDNRRIITGSYNWTRNASAHNSENCILFDMLTGEYGRRFDYLWHMYGG